VAPLCPAGDYATQSDNPARQLTQYARALNGAKGTGSSAASRSMASHDTLPPRAWSVPCQRTSGPFQLDLRADQQPSRSISVTRDRNQSAIILNDKPLTGVTITDRAVQRLLLLKNPVASIDALESHLRVA